MTRTVPGAFLDLVLGAVADQFRPARAHGPAEASADPARAASGRDQEAARALERGAFRDVYVGQGLAGARARAQGATGSRRGNAWHSPRMIAKRRLPLIARPRTRLRAADALFVATIPAHRRTTCRRPMSRTAEALARDANGSSSALWQGEAGEALTVLLAELIDSGVAPHHASRGLSALLSQPGREPGGAAACAGASATLHLGAARSAPATARRRDPRQPQRGRMAEAARGRSLAQPSHAREAWSCRRPSVAPASPPTISRRRSAPEPSISPARMKVDGVPTVPSRWLQRLLAAGQGGEASKPCIEPEEPWVAWARERDRAPEFAPVEAARAPPAGRCKAARAERDPHRAMDRQSLRDLRQGYSGTGIAEAARHRARSRPCAAASSIACCMNSRPLIRTSLPADIEAELIRLAEAAFRRAWRLAARRGVLAAAFRALRPLVRGDRAGAPCRHRPAPIPR